MSSIDVTIKRETKTGGREEGRGRQERRKRRGVEKNRRNGRVRARTLSRTFRAATVWRSERGMVAQVNCRRVQKVAKSIKIFYNGAKMGGRGFESRQKRPKLKDENF